MNTTFAIVGFTSLGVCLGWGPTEHPAATALRNLANIELKDAKLEISHEGKTPVPGRPLQFKGSFKIANSSRYLAEILVAIYVVKFIDGKPVDCANGGMFVYRDQDGVYAFNKIVEAKNLKPGKYEVRLLCNSEIIYRTPLTLK